MEAHYPEGLQDLVLLGKLSTAHSHVAHVAYGFGITTVPLASEIILDGYQELT